MRRRYQAVTSGLIPGADLANRGWGEGGIDLARNEGPAWLSRTEGMRGASVAAEAAALLFDLCNI